MRPTDGARFQELITNVMAYYRQDVSDFIMGIWWEGLKNAEFEQVAKALTRHATDPENGRFPPKVADIVRQLQGTPTDRSAAAWGKVFDAMGRVGAYQDVVFDDPVIHAVLADLGGWPTLCRTDTEELGYVRHRFGESYNAYARMGEFTYPRSLIGDRSPDHEYTNRGWPLPEPVLVGDREAALKVLRDGSGSGKTPISISHPASSNAHAVVALSLVKK